MLHSPCVMYSSNNLRVAFECRPTKNLPVFAVCSCWACTLSSVNHFIFCDCACVVHVGMGRGAGMYVGWCWGLFSSDLCIVFPCKNCLWIMAALRCLTTAFSWTPLRSSHSHQCSIYLVHVIDHLLSSHFRQPVNSRINMTHWQLLPCKNECCSQPGLL